MPNPTEYAIETHELIKTYTSKIKAQGQSILSSRQSRTVKAVNTVNLKIRKGELLGLLGPNGAGKTTLVKVLCTLLPPDFGTALVNSFDVINQQMQAKHSTSTLFNVGERSFFWRISD